MILANWQKGGKVYTELEPAALTEAKTKDA